MEGADESGSVKQTENEQPAGIQVQGTFSAKGLNQEAQQSKVRKGGHSSVVEEIEVNGEQISLKECA